MKNAVGSLVFPQAATPQIKNANWKSASLPRTADEITSGIQRHRLPQKRQSPQAINLQCSEAMANFLFIDSRQVVLKESGDVILSNASIC
ncbi:MAG: hypothetical protein JO066_09100 [Verrucomicrobia bacterium]|nr:hypothetical protein [Verrucomicrobiota bacterium]